MFDRTIKAMLQDVQDDVAAMACCIAVSSAAFSTALRSGLSEIASLRTVEPASAPSLRARDLVDTMRILQKFTKCRSALSTTREPETRHPSHVKGYSGDW